MRLLILPAIFATYGVLYVVFAFVDPPPALSGWFRVPAVFVFVPPRHRVRAGRLFSGVLLLVTPAIVALAISRWR